MSRQCYFCNKKTTAGRTYTTRGLPKYKGGIGLKTTGKTRRVFKPNIQKIRLLVDGTTRRVKICAACLRSNKAMRPPVRQKVESN